MIESGEKWAVEPGAVEEHQWLLYETELIPGEDLEGFVKGAESPWHHDESARQLGHSRLAFVHRIHDVEDVESGMGGLGSHQWFGDHTVHESSGVQNRIGHHTHEPDPTPAVDESEIGLGDGPTEFSGFRGEFGSTPRTRSAVHAHQTTHVTSVSQGAGDAW